MEVKPVDQRSFLRYWNMVQITVRINPEAQLYQLAEKAHKSYRLRIFIRVTLDARRIAPASAAHILRVWARKIFRAATVSCMCELM